MGSGGGRMGSSGGRVRTAIAAVPLLLCTGIIVTTAGQLTPADAVARLAAMHPDQADYIAGVSIGKGRADGVVYAGLVRPGGSDPADEDDAPVRGKGVRNQLVIFPDALSGSHSAAWIDVILDHEYFHARHLSRGFPIPLASFGNERIDRNYLEALAWGWIVSRIDDGLHAGLAPKERAEVRGNYERHLDSFRGFVMERQPEAWAHYGRFFPHDEEPTLLAAAP